MNATCTQITEADATTIRVTSAENYDQNARWAILQSWCYVRRDGQKIEVPFGRYVVRFFRTRPTKKDVKKVEMAERNHGLSTAALDLAQQKVLMGIMKVLGRTECSDGFSHRSVIRPEPMASEGTSVVAGYARYSVVEMDPAVVKAIFTARADHV